MGELMGRLYTFPQVSKNSRVFGYILKCEHDIYDYDIDLLKT